MNGYPGKDVTIVRPKGKAWYIGGINGENKAKKRNIELSFLTPGKSYTVTIIADGDNDSRFNIKTINASSISKLNIDVLPLGGFVVVVKQL